MSCKLRVLISAILLTPAAAFGLGLGEIRLGSSLNEPFAAEIDLVAATPEELATLNAQLASTEVFSRYGLDRPAFLGSLEFSVGRGQDGRSVLLVRSRDPISEPFVSFLIDVNWPRGRLLREYTVLLDPPAMLAAGDSPAPASIAAPTTTPQQPAAARLHLHLLPQLSRHRRHRRRRRPRQAVNRVTRSRAATRSTASRAASPAASATRSSAR